MVSNSLMLGFFFAVLSLNVIDAVLTWFAVGKRGMREQASVTRRMIDKLGLRKAMILKSLLPLLFVILIVISWNNELYGYTVATVLILLTIEYSYVVAHDCIVLTKNPQKPQVPSELPIKES